MVVQAPGILVSEIRADIGDGWRDFSTRAPIVIVSRWPPYQSLLAVALITETIVLTGIAQVVRITVKIRDVQRLGIPGY